MLLLPNDINMRETEQIAPRLGLEINCTCLNRSQRKMIWRDFIYLREIEKVRNAKKLLNFFNQESSNFFTRNYKN